MPNVELVADNGGGNLAVAHGSHSGTIAPAFPHLPGGASDRSAVILTCPTCGASSLWPIGGGADPDQAADLAAVAGA